MKLVFSLLALSLAAGVSMFGAGAASAQDQQFFAVLLGGNEISGGDPDGYGGATITFHGTKKVCVGITVDLLDTPTAAHIHQGKAGTNGPVVVPLKEPSRGSPGGSSLCATLDPALAASILASPSDFYVNVHTVAFPGGSVRGQLF
jgi:hypothetical protein